MKLKHLESIIQDCKTFLEPKYELEQYNTTPHLAACMLLTAHLDFGDIEGKTVADLGSGAGILSVASAILGSSYNICVDIDPNALEIASENSRSYELDLQLLNSSIESLPLRGTFHPSMECFDF